MSEQKILGSAFEAAEMLGTQFKRDESGRLLNRSTCYDVVRRLPEDMKVYIGSSLRIHLPKLRQWIDEGGSRNEQRAA